MKNHRIYYIFLLILLYNASFGQNAEIDSLKRVVDTDKRDTIRLKALSDLNWLLSSKDAALSKKYGFDELKIARKIDDKKWISQAYNDIGISFYKLGDLDSSLYCYTKAYEIREKLNDKNLLGGVAVFLKRLGRKCLVPRNPIFDLPPVLVESRH